LKFNLTHQLQGLLVGAIFSGLVSLVVWAFAYFGYINLGLPQRYDYETINHTINKELPENYNYKSTLVENFRQPDTKSILVVATHKGFGGASYDKTVDSDIIFLLDKTDKEYEVTYKFQPDKREYPMHVRTMSIKDINGDKRPEISIGWSELGAHWSNTFLSVFKSTGLKVNIAGSPKLADIVRDDSGGHKEDKVTNKFNSTERVTSYRSEYFVAKEGGIAVINRNYDSCNACWDEDLWHINYLSYWGDRLVESGFSHKDIQGDKKMYELLKNDGYEW